MKRSTPPRLPSFLFAASSFSRIAQLVISRKPLSIPFRPPRRRANLHGLRKNFQGKKYKKRNEARHILGSNNFNDVEQIFEERRFYKMLENSHEAMVTVDRCPDNVHTLIIIYTHNKKIIGEEYDKSHPSFSMGEQL